MDIRQNPFSVYDFLGYLIPGAFALYVLAALGAWAVPGLTFYAILEEYLSFGTPEAYIPFVIGAYVAGHVFSYLSSVTVEKYSVYAYGYPSKYLLGWEFPGYLEIGNTDKPRRRKIWRVVLFLVLLPVTALDLVVGKWMGGRELYARSLDDRLSESVKESVAPLIARFAGTPAELADVFKEDTDFFRFLYHFGLEQSKGHLSKFQNYVALYGFLRTLSVITVLVFWVLAVLWLISPLKVLDVVIPVLFSAALSYVLYMGFVKFYRRFTLEVFMAVAAISAAAGPATE